MSVLTKIFVLYLIGMNLYGFCLMGWDKKKARKDQWRVPEKKLLSVALFGGSLGCWIGMQEFRHKTKHRIFSVGIPVIFFVQLVILLYLFTGRMMLFKV